jgi:hypothetical protein
VWAWGSNADGGLGFDPSESIIPTPRQMPGLPAVAQVSLGTAVSAGLDLDGRIWLWGPAVGTYVPQLITSLEPIQSVTADTFLMVLAVDGSLYGWGTNGAGNIGDGTSCNCFRRFVDVGLTASEVTVGGLHSVAIARDLAPPVVTAPVNGFNAGDTLSSTDVPLRLTWSGSDAISGVAQYDLQVSNDDATWTSVSLATPLSTVATVRVALNAPVRFRVRARDQWGNWSVPVSGPRIMPAAIDQTANVVTFSAGWSTQSGKSFYAGSQAVSTTSGATATVDFTGNRIAWVAQVARSGGQADVIIDGTVVARVNLATGSVGTRRLVFTTALSAGPHRLRIRRVGPAGASVWVDAFVISG